MQIIIHRGAHQIGGCIAEIRTKQARILIDVGAELSRVDKTAGAVPVIQGVTQEPRDCDAVFITHYHSDHVGAAGSVLPEIPIYMGATAKKIHLAVQRTLKKKLGKGDPERVETFRTFEAKDEIVIKDMRITPFTVDHSAFDAYMFLIEAEGKRILHTGDFRMHGARGRKMPAVFKTFARDVDVLITEGTMLSRAGERKGPRRFLSWG